MVMVVSLKTVDGVNRGLLLQRMKTANQESDARIAKEDPELWARMQAARKRTSQEITLPTSTGYELKPGADK